MAKLHIEYRPCSHGLKTAVISGFTDKELSELKSMEHNEAYETLLDMLDRRNNGIATNWIRSVGTYALWFDNEFAYLNIGDRD